MGIKESLWNYTDIPKNVQQTMGNFKTIKIKDLLKKCHNKKSRNAIALNVIIRTSKPIGR